ncbi:MAG: hypothetical protein NWR72_14755 [Bacteroidia bacterium]|nr:hypothetical protein [Bacteroidia bacterium]
MSDQEEDQDLQQLFPFVKKWKTLYAFVLGELVVLIVLFYLFSHAFS